MRCGVGVAVHGCDQVLLGIRGVIYWCQFYHRLYVCISLSFYVLLVNITCVDGFFSGSYLVVTIEGISYSKHYLSIYLSIYTTNIPLKEARQGL